MYFLTPYAASIDRIPMMATTIISSINVKPARDAWNRKRINDTLLAIYYGSALVTTVQESEAKTLGFSAAFAASSLLPLPSSSLLCLTCLPLFALARTFRPRQNRRQMYAVMHRVNAPVGPAAPPAMSGDA